MSGRWHVLVKAHEMHHLYTYNVTPFTLAKFEMVIRKFAQKLL